MLIRSVLISVSGLNAAAVTLLNILGVRGGAEITRGIEVIN